MRNRIAAATLLSSLVWVSCSSVSKSGDGVARVGDLMDCVQRVHVDTELGKQRMRTAYAVMNTVLAKEYKSEPTVAFREFLQGIEESESQANQLKTSVRQMRASAQTVFEQWNTDLMQIQSPEMRERSEARLETTRGRYQALLAAARSAESTFDKFNKSIRDLSLFLGHDLNKAAIDEVRDDASALAELVEDLDGRFDVALTAASQYLDAAALAQDTTTPTQMPNTTPSRAAAKPSR